MKIIAGIILALLVTGCSFTAAQPQEVPAQIPVQVVEQIEESKAEQDQAIYEKVCKEAHDKQVRKRWMLVIVVSVYLAVMPAVLAFKLRGNNG